MSDAPVWRTRKDDHDHMTREHAEGFLRQGGTGTDNVGRHALAEILSYYPEPRRVLDGACGSAVNYEVFRNLQVPVDYTGLDRTSVLLDVARDKYGDGVEGYSFKAEEGYIEEMPFADNEFDVVILRHILEHLEEGYEVAIKEALRVAEKEVVLVFFLTPHGAWEHNIEERPSGDTGCTHFWNTYSWPQLVQFLTGFGVQVKRHTFTTPGAVHPDTIVRLIK